MTQFATVIELADYMGEKFTDAADARATLMLELASAAIQNEARQRIEKVDNDLVVLRGNTSSELRLPERPVRAIDSIQIASDPVLATTQYTWSRGGAVFLELGYWGGHAVAVTVQYDHGFEVTPADIKAICLQAAARGMGNPEGLLMETNLSSTYQYQRSSGVLLVEDERRAVRRYRLGQDAWIPAS